MRANKILQHGDGNMPKSENGRKRMKKVNGLNLRKLKKELKLIPFDIQREVRFLDLLFAERNLVRTEVERDVLRELIDRAKKMVVHHQNRLDRYKECYKQYKSKKSFDTNLLLPDELLGLLKLPPQESGLPQDKADFRTGTDG